MGTLPSQVGPAPRLANIGPAPEPAKHARRKWLQWGIAAGVALALIAGGLFWRSRLQNAITYETVPVEQGAVQAKVTATGNLNAVVEVLVSSQVSGNIKALYANWNSHVRKGSWWR